MSDLSADTMVNNFGLTSTEMQAFEAALADREAEEVGADSRRPAADEDRSTAVLPRDHVSARAADLIIRHETGGRAYYQQVIKERPVWPRGQSGITIGFGYDLGYVARAQFLSDWAVLPQAALDALAIAIGRHGGNSSDAEMKSLLAELRNAAVIGWEVAEAVFRATTLPTFADTTARVLPNWSLLSPDCFGALVSLTFNRGPSYNRAGDRYREMRAIKDALVARRFADIGGHIRAMKRIWIGSAIETEMLRRRENEAALYDAGLAALTVPLAPTRPSAEEDGRGPQNEAEDWVEFTEEDIADGLARGRPLFEGVESGSRPVWPKDAHAPDYAHLRLSATDAPFDLDAEDLALLAELNDFPIAGSDVPILFGLRGCGIVRAAGGILLKDQRPDHMTPRCALGVWNRATGAVSVFPGSTVPDRRAVVKWQQTRKAGNLLPTGCYGYIVGPHATVGRNGVLNSRPGCFLLRKSLDEKREVIVRRSSEDLAYEVGDMVDRSRPGDNIHPTFFSEPVDFSSFGCQTVVGFADNGGNHRGPWAEFRRAAGLTDADGTPGKSYLYMLLTGAEARRASELRRSGLAADPQSRRQLRRLRFGSRGPAVTRLQTRLGLPDPDGSFGPNTAAAFYARQQSLTPAREADGIFTPGLDEALGFGVFSALGT